MNGLVALRDCSILGLIDRQSFPMVLIHCIFQLHSSLLDIVVYELIVYKSYASTSGDCTKSAIMRVETVLLNLLEQCRNFPQTLYCRHQYPLPPTNSRLTVPEINMLWYPESV